MPKHTKQGMHKMPGDYMMSDKEMGEHMGTAKPKGKPKRGKGKK